MFTSSLFRSVPIRWQELFNAHSEYATEWNRSERRSGHVWQRWYFSCPLDPGHVVTALRYVDLNPVRAQLVDAATQCDWSSARAHSDRSCRDALLGLDWWTGLTNGTILDGRRRWGMTEMWMGNGKCCGVRR